MMDTWPDMVLRFARRSTDFSVRVLRGLLWPKLELAIRLWLAQMFFVFGALKLTHWQTALYLASHEYPVAWMSPASAAYVGVSIEVLGGALRDFMDQDREYGANGSVVAKGRDRINVMLTRYGLRYEQGGHVRGHLSATPSRT